MMKCTTNSGPVLQTIALDVVMILALSFKLFRQQHPSRVFRNYNTTALDTVLAAGCGVSDLPDLAALASILHKAEINRQNNAALVVMRPLNGHQTNQTLQQPFKKTASTTIPTTTTANITTTTTTTFSSGSNVAHHLPPVAALAASVSSGNHTSSLQLQTAEGVEGAAARGWDPITQLCVLANRVLEAAVQNKAAFSSTTAASSMLMPLSTSLSSSGAAVNSSGDGVIPRPHASNPASSSGTSGSSSSLSSNSTLSSSSTGSTASARSTRSREGLSHYFWRYGNDDKAFIAQLMCQPCIIKGAGRPTDYGHDRVPSSILTPAATALLVTNTTGENNATTTTTSYYNHNCNRPLALGDIMGTLCRIMLSRGDQFVPTAVVQSWTEWLLVAEGGNNHHYGCDYGRSSNKTATIRSCSSRDDNDNSSALNNDSALLQQRLTVTDLSAVATEASIRDEHDGIHYGDGTINTSKYSSSRSSTAPPSGPIYSHNSQQCFNPLHISNYNGLMMSITAGDYDYRSYYSAPPAATTTTSTLHPISDIAAAWALMGRANKINDFTLSPVFEHLYMRRKEIMCAKDALLVLKAMALSQASDALLVLKAMALSQASDALLVVLKAMALSQASDVLLLVVLKAMALSQASDALLVVLKAMALSQASDALLVVLKCFPCPLLYAVVAVVISPHNYNATCSQPLSSLSSPGNNGECKQDLSSTHPAVVIEASTETLLRHKSQSRSAVNSDTTVPPPLSVASAGLPLGTTMMAGLLQPPLQPQLPQQQQAVQSQAAAATAAEVYALKEQLVQEILKHLTDCSRRSSSRTMNKALSLQETKQTDESSHFSSSAIPVAASRTHSPQWQQTLHHQQEEAVVPAGSCRLQQGRAASSAAAPDINCSAASSAAAPDINCSAASSAAAPDINCSAAAPDINCSAASSAAAPDIKSYSLPSATQLGVDNWIASAGRELLPVLPAGYPPGHDQGAGRQDAHDGLLVMTTTADRRKQKQLIDLQQEEISTFSPPSILVPASNNGSSSGGAIMPADGNDKILRKSRTKSTMGGSGKGKQPARPAAVARYSDSDSAPAAVARYSDSDSAPAAAIRPPGISREPSSAGAEQVPGGISTASSLVLAGAVVRMGAVTAPALRSASIMVQDDSPPAKEAGFQKELEAQKAGSKNEAAGKNAHSSPIRSTSAESNIMTARPKVHQLQSSDARNVPLWLTLKDHSNLRLSLRVALATCLGGTTVMVHPAVPPATSTAASPPPHGRSAVAAREEASRIHCAAPLEEAARYLLADRNHWRLPLQRPAPDLQLWRCPRPEDLKLLLPLLPWLMPNQLLSVMQLAASASASEYPWHGLPFLFHSQYSQKNDKKVDEGPSRAKPASKIHGRNRVQYYSKREFARRMNLFNREKSLCPEPPIDPHNLSLLLSCYLSMVATPQITSHYHRAVNRIVSDNSGGVEGLIDVAWILAHGLVVAPPPSTTINQEWGLSYLSTTSPQLQLSTTGLHGGNMTPNKNASPVVEVPKIRTRILHRMMKKARKEAKHFLDGSLDSPEDKIAAERSKIKISREDSRAVFEVLRALLHRHVLPDLMNTSRSEGLRRLSSTRLVMLTETLVSMEDEIKRRQKQNLILDLLKHSHDSKCSSPAVKSVLPSRTINETPAAEKTAAAAASTGAETPSLLISNLRGTEAKDYDLHENQRAKAKGSEGDTGERSKERGEDEDEASHQNYSGLFDNLIQAMASHSELSLFEAASILRRNDPSQKDEDEIEDKDEDEGGILGAPPAVSPTHASARRRYALSLLRLENAYPGSTEKVIKQAFLDKQPLDYMALTCLLECMFSEVYKVKDTRQYEVTLSIAPCSVNMDGKQPGAERQKSEAALNVSLLGQQQQATTKNNAEEDEKMVSRPRFYQNLDVRIMTQLADVCKLVPKDCVHILHGALFANPNPR
ncbi:hypothetical protein CEUSTIGMA_g13561.t1 [Chlamydomonas eustigma]|uniref:Uncharacterized protein n=1 Tax=Chlamydomonas eustigma TaxID=1157962 RepID=A0A250XSW6_9CHLO|nr:hypothetical protein CEUSTIGMA_g13561.t1 [Chlamydomonas eustigma]|eukprot:GAX86148.1 hypothetical protein CEUSTIGMA_g13561.t1 [Chlamydomonas eustigma]